MNDPKHIDRPTMQRLCVSIAFALTGVLCGCADIFHIDLPGNHAYHAVFIILVVGGVVRGAQHEMKHTFPAAYDSFMKKRGLAGSGEDTLVLALICSLTLHTLAFSAIFY